MSRARGMTLVEVLIAMVLAGIVLGTAIKFFLGMNVALAGTIDRLDAMQNLRYGVQNIDRELRAAGAGTVEVQPTLVYISPSVVTFNADLVSATANSPTAVYYNPDVDPNATNEVTLAQRFTIPTTAVQYPDSTYRSSGGMVSPAETITYYFVLDTSTVRTDDYVLMRQVNNSPPDVVARNLLPFPGRPFFEWLRTDTAGNLQTVSATGAAPYPALPWRHLTPIHGSTADTAQFGAYIDSIRAVRVSIYGTNGRTGAAEVQRALVTTVRIPNAGLSKQRSCGDAPIFARTVTATFTGSAAAPVVRLSWTPAVDESGGEKDVEKYVIYRRTVAAATFDDALQSVPAGQPSYTFDDSSVLNDSSYVYGVTALDCTPLESSAVITTALLIPPAP